MDVNEDSDQNQTPSAYGRSKEAFTRMRLVPKSHVLACILKISDGQSSRMSKEERLKLLQLW